MYYNPLNKIRTHDSILINHLNFNLDKKEDIYIIYHKNFLYAQIFSFLGSPLLLT